MALKIIEWEDFISPAFPENSKSAMAIGVFDGMHLGHQELIKRIVKHGPNPTVLTFRENPKKRVSPDTYEGDIFSLRQKLAAFESLGLERVVLVDFSEDFSKLKGSEFLDLLESRGKVAFLAIGSDFRCGYKQDTDADLILEMNKRKGIPTEIVPPVFLPGEAEGILVSSSRIRTAIAGGNLELAAALMGRNFELDVADLDADPDLVERGIRKTLKYSPRTANRIAPASGRYSVRVNPGGIEGRVDAQDGKVFLEFVPDIKAGKPESLDFSVRPDGPCTERKD